MKKLIDTANASYQRKGNVKLGLIVVLVCVVALAAAAAFVIPKLIEMDREDVYKTADDPITVTAIVPFDGGKIGVDADLSQVYVTVRYSDGSEAEVALSEVIVTGLDTTTSGTLDNVVLDFGGYKQTVTYEVLSTKKVIEYLASTGGKISGDAIQYVNAGSDAGTVVAVPDEGYRFVEWSDGNPNASRTDTKVSVDQALIASFQKMEYTVVFFYPDGTTAREQTVLYNEAATKVPRLSEENMQQYGYVFTGWSESYDHITADTNIYPVYKKFATDIHIEYTAGIDGSPLGTSDATAYYAKEEQAVIRIQANPERLFTGWSVLTLKDGWKSIDIQGDTKTYEIGVQYNYIQFETSRTGTSDEYVIMFTPTADTDEIYFKANFVYKESTISFSSMSTKARGDILLANGEPIGNKFDVESTDTLPAITGYTFKGWYIRNGEIKADGTPVLVKNTQTFNQPTALVAYWEKDMYKVVFLLGDNEDSAFVADENYSEEEKGIVLDVMYQDPLAGAVNGEFPSYTPKKENYTFNGWYLRGAGNVATDTVIDRTYKITEKVTYVVPVFTVNTQYLTAGVEGSGSIYVAKGNSDEFEPVTGKYVMEAISDYKVKVAAGEGYSIARVEVTSSAGTTTYYPTEGVYEFEINAFVVSDFDVQAFFTLSEYKLTIINGYGASGGKVKLQIIEDGISGDVEYDDNIISNVMLSVGVTKHVWISANDGNYIEKITIDENPVTGLPGEATAYTVVLENITKNVRIDITYRAFSYNVTFDGTAYTNPDENTCLIFEETTGPYSLNSKAVYYFQTQGLPYTKTIEDQEVEVIDYSGYYIKAIRVNGFAVDPYNYDKNLFEVSDIVVNYGNYIFANEGDPRITSLRFAVKQIAADKVVTVEYAPLYYKMAVTSLGVGSVDISSATVLYNQPFSVQANTTDGYYVYSASQNNNAVLYENAPYESRRVSIAEVNIDYSIGFEFRLKYHNVNFGGEFATVQYVNDNGETQTEVIPKSISCEYSSDHTFTIIADEGYVIDKVVVNDVERKDIAFDATSYYVTIDDIDRNYDIVVTASNRYVNLTVFTNLPENPDPLEYNSHIQYGSTETIVITAPAGYKYKSYSITPRPQENMMPSLSSGVEDMEGNTRYEMMVYTLEADTEITFRFSVPTEDGSPEIHNIYLDYNPGMGELKENSSITTFTGGSKLVFVAKPKAGFSLKYLVVDGVIVNVNSEWQYTDIVEEAEGDKYVKAVFEETTYNLTVSYNGYGMATPNKWSYKAGEKFLIRVSPMTGYRVSAFLVGETGGQMKPCDEQQLEKFNNGEIDYQITAPAADATVKVEFSPLQYTLIVKTEGSGTVNKTLNTPLQIQYGEKILIDVNAMDNYYIDSIYVNKYDGSNTLTSSTTIDPATLSGNPRMNNEINKYVAGTIAITAVESIEVVVKFKPNVYGVSIADTYYGDVLVRSGNNPRSDGKGVELYAGDSLEVIMMADQGYHIKELVINGVPAVGWELDSTQPNNNANVSYTIPAISGNITIRVSFEINSYDIYTETANSSANFQQYDTVSTSYGTVRVYGYPVLEDGVTYSGITHGSDITFIVTPVRSKGYYVSRFTITWIDPSVRDGVQTKTEDFTMEAYNTGRVGFTVNGAIQTVKAEFSKELFSFESGMVINQLDSTYVADSSLTYTFVNPYEPNNASVIVAMVDGKYEYGLTYILTSVPGVGYTRTAFEVNGYDRNTSVRNNKYTGTITTDTLVVATYTIDYVDVNLASNAYDKSIDFWKGEFTIYIETVNGREKLWTPTYVNPLKGVVGTTGTATASTSSLRVTYNTQLYVEVKPFNNINKKPYDPNSSEVNGYRTSKFTFGQTNELTDEDAFLQKTVTVTQNTSMEVSFSLHTYRVSLVLNTQNSGTMAKVSSDSIEWGGSATISVTVGVGYNLSEVLINNTVDYVAWEALSKANGGSYVISDITGDKVVTLNLECKPLDITFKSEGYKQSFVVDGSVEYSNTGVVFNGGTDKEKGYFAYANEGYSIITNNKITGENGARYNDTITLYFMPVDGYKLASINIVMYDLSGNKYFSMSDVNSVTIYDEIHGYSRYSLPVAMMGEIEITVSYAIKTYQVSITTLGLGSIVSEYASVVSHHETLNYVIRASYGYHLSSLSINGTTVPTSSSKVKANGSDYYQYYINDGKGIKVDNVLVGNNTKFEIKMEFEVNRFAVKMYVNNIDVTALIPDETLKPSIDNNAIQYGTGATGIIVQEKAEGYSITNIVLTNQKGTTQINGNFMGGVDQRKLDVFSFPISGEVMDMLNYHDNTENVLYVYYTTAIDTHLSVITSHLYENNLDEDVIPVDDFGNDVFVLSASYSDGKSGNDTLHDYGTSAKIDFTMKDGENYEFAGFQEYDSSTKTWKYVKNGENGIEVIGDSIRYTIKSNRYIRAVVFRMYDVRVEVHPEYKYLSGSISSSTFNMTYRTYIKMTATAKYAEGKTPNTTEPSVVLSDYDQVPNDGVFVYKVYAFAVLNLKGDDTLTGSGMNVSSSVSYFYVESEDGNLQETEVPFATTGAVVDGDRTVYAYYVNTTYLSFKFETVGGSTGAEGGTVTYYSIDPSTGKATAMNLAGGNLRVTANSQVRIVIEPKENYAFESFEKYDVLDTPGTNNNKQFNGTWSEVVNDQMGFTKVTKTIDIDGSVSRVTVDLVVTENMIYKVKFWKLIKVTSTVTLYEDETSNTEVLQSKTPSFVSKDEDKVYKYLDEVSYEVPTVYYDNAFDITYQFVGFIVNGVNAYRQLSNSYPTTMSMTFSLQSYNANEAPNGIYIMHDGSDYVANIVARYIPVYNITFENEYLFENQEDSYSTYFDIGQISYRTTQYNYEYPIYYQTTSYVSSKLETTAHTDSTIQVLGKINSAGTTANDLNNPGTGYNTWSDNVITLSWVSGSITQYTEKFEFIAWQYYAVVGGVGQWINIPDTYSSSSSNKNTSKTFSFPIKALISGSYMGASGTDIINNQTDYIYGASEYDSNGNYVGSRSIYTIRIRPLLQRLVNVSLERQVYYTASGVEDPSHATDNPAFITQNRSTTGSFGYYDVITLTPSTQDGYRFLGWYHSPDGDDKIDVVYTTDDDLDANTPYAVDSTSNTLHIRLTNDSYIDQTTNYIKVYARYIKEWTITFMTRNESGSSSLMNGSVPYIKQLFVNDAGSVTGYQNHEQLINLVVDAGTILYFGLYDYDSGADDKFDDKYDKYVRTETLIRSRTVWGTNLADEDYLNSRLPVADSTSVNYSQYVDSLYNAQFTIYANNDKTITAYFKSYGELTINNIYYGSSIAVPESLRAAMGWSSDRVEDGGVRDGDGKVNGSITIKEIPISTKTEYDGRYGNILPNTMNPLDIGGNTVGVVFRGTGIANKCQYFSYYNSDANTQDSYTQKNVPFTDGLKPNAGVGTSTNPYKISNQQELQFIESLYNGNDYNCTYKDAGNNTQRLCFKLVGSFSLNASYTPMCAADGGNGFNGTFDGNNNVIGGMNGLGGDYVGLFAKASNAIFTRVAFASGLSIGSSTSEYVGYLVGYALDTQISSINTSSDSNSISVSGDKAGVIAGFVGGNSVISECNVTRPYLANGSYIGGLVGELSGTSKITGCSVAVPQIHPDKEKGGGLVGYVSSKNATIENCDVRADSNASFGTGAAKHIGGAVGYNAGSMDDVSVNLGNVNTFIAAKPSTAFTTSGPRDYSSYGISLITGFNAGRMNNCNLLGSGLVTAEAALVGGICGINTGTVTSCNTASYRFTVSHSLANGGGIFGVQVGYNNGTINGTSTSYSSSNEYSVDDSVFFIGNGTSTSVEGNAESYANDSSAIYLGGVAGYNGSAGVILNASFTGKLYINRRCGNGSSNKTFMGGIMGYNNNDTSGAFSGNSVVNAYIKMFLNVWTDDSTSPTTSYQYMSDIVGDGSYNGSYGSVSGNVVTLDRVANGVKYTPHEVKNYQITWINYSKWSANAKDYNTAKAESKLSVRGGTLEGSDYVTKSIPTELYNAHANDCYEYTGNLRQFTTATRTIVSI